MRTSMLVLPRALGLAAALACAAAFPGAARANGAFPDSGQLILPPGQPEQIGIGTNFGLVLTDDGGASWSWVCENAETDLGTLYQTGIEGRLLAVSRAGLVYSDDGACGWSRAGGALAALTARDVFVDKTDPHQVLAVASGAGGVMTVHRSNDGGATFGEALHTGDPYEVFTGVESSRSDPNVVYLVSYVGPGIGSNLRVKRSDDAGAHWQVLPMSAAYEGVPRLVAVDAGDPLRMLIRLSPTLGGERLVLSSDGGQSFRTAMELNGRFSAYLLRGDGTMLLAGEVNAQGVGFQSRDRGETFTPWALPLRVRALGERDGVLYAATPAFAGGMSLVTSRDDGASYQPMTSYDRVQRIKPCVASACQTACSAQAQFGLWEAAVCGGSATPPALDASVPAEAGVAAERDPPGGCGCWAGGNEDGRAGDAGAPVVSLRSLSSLLLLLVLLAPSQRRRRATSSPTRAPRTSC